MFTPHSRTLCLLCEEKVLNILWDEMDALFSGLHKIQKPILWKILFILQRVANVGKAVFRKLR
jgi:hypothetical protein